MPTLHLLGRSVGALLLGTAAAIAAPSLAQATDLTLATNGTHPGIFVDDAGTGHLAWLARTGSTNQVVYCRLPRGASDCAVRKVFNTPGNSGTWGRAQVLRTPDAKLVVVATLDSNVQAWTSSNDGDAWSAPTVIAKGPNVNQAVLGSGGFTVNLVGGLSPKFVSAGLDGANATTEPIDLYSPIPNNSVADDGSVGMLNSTTPFFAYSEGGASYVRRFNPSTVGVNDVSHWFPKQKLGDAEWETVAASGPSGAFVAATAKTGHPLGNGLMVRRIREDGTIEPTQNIRAPFASTGVGSSNSVVRPTLFEDAGGRLHTVYSLADGDNPIVYQWSKRGETWGQPITLAASASQARNYQVGAATDGGGWLTYEANPAAFGEIHVIDLAAKGDSDPPVPAPASPAPGAPPTPTPPPAAACPLKVTVSANASATVRSGPCFKDLGKGRYSTTGTVRLAGLDLVPSGGATTTVDTKAHRVQTKGKVEITAGSVVLSRSPVDWDLDQQTTIPDLGGFGVSLLGFKLTGTADLTFVKGEARIHVYVKLPAPIDAVTGDTTLRATMADGLRLDDLHLHAEDVPIGPVRIDEFDVVFTGGTNRFEGSASVTLPPAAGKSLVASFGMENGTIKHLDLEAGEGSGILPLALWATPPVFLGRVGLTYKNDDAGFRIGGGVKIDAGASIAGHAPLSIDALPSSGGGAYVFVPKSRKYAEIGAKGKLTVVDIPLASGGFVLRTDGPIVATGSTGIDVGPLDVEFKMTAGVNLSNGDFYGEGSGSGCANGVLVIGCGSVTGIVSSIGISLCGEGELADAFTKKGIPGELGFSRPWGGDSDIGSCDLESYKPASLKGIGARLRAAGAQTFSLGAGAMRGVRVQGSGGLPGFTLSGPGGRTVTVPAGLTDAATGDGLVAFPAGDDAVEVQVSSPAGDWTVTPTGGPAVTQVLTAGERPQPKARASVGRAAKGSRARTLRLTASNLGGQRLLVRELLPGGGTQELGTVGKEGTTTLRFTPSDGPGGRRTIEAIVLSGDRQVDTVRLGAYTAPGPVKLAAPRTVRVSRGKVTTVRWSKVAGAAGYLVVVKGSDGRRQQLVVGPKGTSAKLSGVTPDDRLDVRVQATTKLGRPGASRAATSKGRRLR
ncbi:MAG: hypothetical protein PGN13_05240 [Patulibacter minatonensis]